MPLPVVSLSSLASRVVLAHKLDTRELPRHLHSQMEQYKRQQGAFTLLSTDFVMEGTEGRELSHEDKDYALQSFLDSPEGEVIMKFDVEVAKLGDTKWSITKLGPRTTTVHLQDPVKMIHYNDKGFSRTKYHTTYITYRTCYLNDGKVLAVEKNERCELNGGHVVVQVNTSSYEVDSAGQLTWVLRSEEPGRGLISTLTARGVRTHQLGNCNVFVGNEEFKESVLSKTVVA